MNEQLIIKTIPANKTEQKALASHLAESVLNGDINPVDAVVQAKSLSETINAFLKDTAIIESVINECEKYGKGETPSFKGATIQVRETGVKYDYSVCHDPEWDELNAQLQDIKESMKVREAYLHAIGKPKTEVDEQTGEVYTLYPAVRTSTTTYAITFKK